jgi:Na+-transporting NADH:ubiquinone oxidoreductase subunit C
VPRLDSPRYTIAFAAVVSVACAALVAIAAVSLRSRQEANAQVYRQKNVLLAAGLAKPDERLADAAVMQRFDERVTVRAIDLASGELLPEDQLDARSYDPRKARADPQQSRAAPPNAAGIARLPNYQTVYLVKGAAGETEQVVLPIEGMGMWGTVAGFLALGTDGNTVRGITFYEQKETPGLGGEISNPRWQALWIGRKAYDAAWEPRLTVIKGRAGPPEQDPHKVDGLSGATITSNGVANVVRFWLSRDGYGPWLARLREGAKA